MGREVSFFRPSNYFNREAAILAIGAISNSK